MCHHMLHSIQSFQIVTTYNTHQLPTLALVLRLQNVSCAEHKILVTAITVDTFRHESYVLQSSNL